MTGSSPRRFRPLLLFTAGAVVAVLTVIAILQLVHIDLAIGNMVIRSQSGASHPFPLPTAEMGPAALDAPSSEGAGATPVRNVILLIGDGMGVGQVSTLSTLLHGPGGSGLALEQAPVVGLARTWASNNLVVDSAAAGTAMATGFTTNKMMVATLPDGRRVKTLLEAARGRGMATAVLTTSFLVDATPSCFTVHSKHRDHHGHILDQMLDSGTDILIGGDSRILHRQTDGEELDAAVQRLDRVAEHGYTLVRTEQELLAADGKILGLFASRNGGVSAHGPPLESSTAHMLGILDRAEAGFFAVVESEVLDQVGHANHIAGLVNGGIEFDRAVQAALDFAAGRDDTLVVVTADHSTGCPGIVGSPITDGIAKVRWATDGHTSHWMPVFAFGPGAETFAGVYDQRDLARIFARALALADFPAVIQQAD